MRGGVERSAGWARIKLATRVFALALAATTPTLRGADPLADTPTGKLILPKVEFKDARIGEAVDFLNHKITQLGGPDSLPVILVGPRDGQEVSIDLNIRDAPLAEVVKQIAAIAHLETITSPNAAIILKGHLPAPPKPPDPRQKVETFPGSADARPLVEERIRQESEGRIRLLNFETSNGKREPFVTYYSFDWKAEIEFLKDGWSWLPVDPSYDYFVMPEVEDPEIHLDLSAVHPGQRLIITGRVAVGPSPKGWGGFKLRPVK